jgi:DNA-binding transcriptional regulator YdaS (Cro superfamily)
MNAREKQTALKALESAIEKAGGLSGLSRLIRVSRQAVLQWRMNGAVPPKKALAVEDATGVSKEQLRPDLYR